MGTLGASAQNKGLQKWLTNRIASSPLHKEQNLAWTLQFLLSCATCSLHCPHLEDRHFPLWLSPLAMLWSARHQCMSDITWNLYWKQMVIACQSFQRPEGQSGNLCIYLGCFSCRSHFEINWLSSNGNFHDSLWYTNKISSDSRPVYIKGSCFQREVCLLTKDFSYFLPWGSFCYCSP